MSNNERKPRRTFGQELIDSAVKLVASEGYALAVAAKAVIVACPTLRQLGQQCAAQNGPAGDKVKLKELEEENRQLRRELRQAELEREIFKKRQWCTSRRRRSEIRQDQRATRLLSGSDHVSCSGGEQERFLQLAQRHFQSTCAAQQSRQMFVGFTSPPGVSTAAPRLPRNYETPRN
jgi:hypothetical protein